MKLNNHFYSIIEKTLLKDVVSYKIAMHSSHPVYKGHFPEAPVAPGVFLLQMIRELTENHLQKSLQINECRSIKFMSILDPFKTPNIDVEIEIVKSEPYFKVKAKAVLQDLTFFKIDGQFTETSASV